MPEQSGRHVNDQNSFCRQANATARGAHGKKHPPAHRARRVPAESMPLQHLCQQNQNVLVGSTYLVKKESRNGPTSLSMHPQTHTPISSIIIAHLYNFAIQHREKFVKTS